MWWHPGATDNKDTTVKRSGYADITKMDDIDFSKAPGYGRGGAMGMYNVTTVKGSGYVEVTKMDSVATEVPGYGGSWATGMDEDTDVKRLGYPELTKLDGAKARANDMDEGTTAG